MLMMTEVMLFVQNAGVKTSYVYFLKLTPARKKVMIPVHPAGREDEVRLANSICRIGL